MPKIVRFHELGGPEKLQFEEIPQQRPGPGEVRIRVQASGLNRAELLYCQGMYLEPAKLPSRLGYEVSGVVEEVGEGVEPSWVGKHVGTVPGFSQNRYGTLGEEAVVPGSAVAEYPPNLTPVQGTAIWMQYMTAYGGLVYHGAVKAGDFVSIPAASSSVGLAAIQIVRDAGAMAIAVTRTSAKRQELLDLGAHFVIASEEEDYAARANEITGAKGVRLTFDPVGGPFVEKLAAAVARGGTIIEYGGLSMQPTPFPLVPLMRKGASMRAFTLTELTADPQAYATAKKYAYDRLADGRFVPRIAKVFPFAETVEAYRYLESNQQVGKVVISVP